MKRVLLAVALAVAGQAGCRSAGAPPPKPTAPGYRADAGRALVGQRRVLRFYGNMKTVSLKMGDLAHQSGPCDIAVEIKTAVFTGDAVRFSLEPIGRPRLEGRPRDDGKTSPCWQLPAETILVVADLDASSADTLAAEAGKILLTPDAYLQIHGVPFDHPAAGEPKEVADAQPTASAAAQRLAEAVTTKERRVLAIDPVYHSENRKVRYEGQVDFVAVVGTDGRLYQPQLTTSLGEHDEEVLRVLPLWRYEPARRGNQPVAVRHRDTTVFRIF